MGSSPTRGNSFFFGKVTALVVPCCFALFVCLTLLVSFFLPSHLSLKHVHVCVLCINFKLVMMSLQLISCLPTCLGHWVCPCHWITDEDDTSLSTTSSLHVPGPCFSVYELRNKLFQTVSPNAVYIYTYKNQIKSFKLPIHWVCIYIVHVHLIHVYSIYCNVLLHVCVHYLLF